MAGIPASRGLGLLIARRREDLGIDQVTFAEQCGWSDRTQREIEKGRRALRTTGEAMAVASLLHMSVEDLEVGEAAPTGGGPPDLTLQAVLDELREVHQEVRDLRGAVAAAVAQLAAGEGGVVVLGELDRALRPVEAEPPGHAAERPKPAAGAPATGTSP